MRWFFVIATRFVYVLLQWFAVLFVSSGICNQGDHRGEIVARQFGVPVTGGDSQTLAGLKPTPTDEKGSVTESDDLFWI